MATKIDHDIIDIGDERIIKNIKRHKFDKYGKINALESTEILQNFGTLNNESLKDKYDFVYVVPGSVSDDSNLQFYLKQLEIDFKRLLGINKTINFITNEIKIINGENFKGKSEDQLKDIQKKFDKTLITDKLNRLLYFYDLLVSFSLQCINCYYWRDITVGDRSDETWGYIIKEVIPIILFIKRKFEISISNEIPKELLQKLFNDYYTY